MYIDLHHMSYSSKNLHVSHTHFNSSLHGSLIPAEDDMYSAYTVTHVSAWNIQLQCGAFTHVSIHRGSRLTSLSYTTKGIPRVDDPLFSYRPRHGQVKARLVALAEASGPAAAVSQGSCYRAPPTIHTKDRQKGRQDSYNIGKRITTTLFRHVTVAKGSTNGQVRGEFVDAKRPAYQPINGSALLNFLAAEQSARFRSTHSSREPVRRVFCWLLDANG